MAARDQSAPQLKKRECQKPETSLKNMFSTSSEARDVTRRAVDALVARHDQKGLFGHVDQVSIPSQAKIISLIEQARRILFPGYFGPEPVNALNLQYQMGQEVVGFYQALAIEITAAIRHDCLRYGYDECLDCQERGKALALAVLEELPEISRLLSTDVIAAKEGDPAAGRHYDQIVFCYPGLFALMVYRLAHELWRLNVPFIPRIMTEHAHSQTGIDIHPGATIGAYFFIDHGTGVVIGETTNIGDRVRLYQGVTLGALSLPRNAGETLSGRKRHPTIEDKVIVYAGATILGGDTVIGSRSVIGGNVWLTHGVPPDSRVILKDPELVITGRGKSAA